MESTSLPFGFEFSQVPGFVPQTEVQVTVCEPDLIPDLKRFVGFCLLSGTTAIR